MLSGSGAQMQTTSYLPGYFHIIDQNVGGSGSLWQVLSNGTTCKIGRVYNVMPEPSGSDPSLAYTKEILRQTMLKHESIFRNQVHELHRLYGRQRELMDEICRSHIQVQTSQSNSIPSQKQCNSFQKGLEVSWPLLTSTRDGKPPAAGENFQLPATSVSEKSTQTGSRIYVQQSALKEERLATSKSHYSRKRVLDLELPAEEYIDSEDEVEFDDRNPIQVPQVPKSTSCSPTESNLKLNEASSSNGGATSKATFSFDLNEPILLDESETPNSANFVDASTEIMPEDQDLSGKSKSESLVQNDESTYNVLERKRNGRSSLIPGFQDSSVAGSPIVCGDRTSLGSEVAKKENEIFDDDNRSMIGSCVTNSFSPLLISSETRTEASTSVSFQKTSLPNFTETPFAIQALPCFNNHDLMSKTSRSSSLNSGTKKYCNSKRNLACIPGLGSVSCCVTGNNDNEHAASHCSLAECSKDSNHAKSSEDMDVHVTPYSCLPGASVSQEKHRRTNAASSSKNSKEQLSKPRAKPDCDGTNLEAPVSPDNKEHPRPRGESEENQIEMPSHSAKQKTRDLKDEFDRIAAETLISISSLGILKTDKCGPLEVSSDCLSWFAAIVSSVTGDQEIERLLNDASSSDQSLLATSEIESIDAKFTTIKIEEDHCPETTNQKSKRIAGIMLPSHQEEKGRARKTRQQRKGSLSGLSCITTPLSSDVTENLWPTEQLIMAAGTTTPGSIKGERHGGRSGRARRSRNLKMASSCDMEGKVCSILKQHTSENELSFTLTSLEGWGRKHSRRKSRQARANYCLRFN